MRKSQNGITSPMASKAAPLITRLTVNESSITAKSMAIRLTTKAKRHRGVDSALPAPMSFLFRRNPGYWKKSSARTAFADADSAWTRMPVDAHWTRRYESLESSYLARRLVRRIHRYSRLACISLPFSCIRQTIYHSPPPEIKRDLWGYHSLYPNPSPVWLIRQQYLYLSCRYRRSNHHCHCRSNRHYHRYRRLNHRCRSNRHCHRLNRHYRR